VTHRMKFLPGAIIHHPGCPTDVDRQTTTIYAVIARDHDTPSYQLAQLNNWPTPDNDQTPLEWMSGINVDESWAIWDPFSDTLAELTTVRAQLNEADISLQAIRVQHRDDVDRLVGERDCAIRRHRQDIEFLGTELNNRATQHSLCKQYDDALREINPDLYFPLPRRSQDYRVGLEVYVTFPLSPSATTEEREARTSEIRTQIVAALNSRDCVIPGNNDIAGRWSIDHAGNDFVDDVD